MDKSKEFAVKKIRQAKNTPEIILIIDKEIVKLSKNKEDEILIPKFLKDLKTDLLQINAIDVNSGEWANIKRARIHLNALKKSYNISNK
ncbi:MAG: hypothetical protein Q7W13_03815 [Bacteroidia bacterium]|jgi:hypothetical protein|nr:hypothetical protein [Bacteroidia bacterium]